jgi:hypothetical protein|tara:strand:+ start:92 stop:457 length:366 start_codon:yes stop_codon:yes gene_type:complete
MEQHLEIISLLTGPASSVVLLVGLVWYAARFVRETVVPAGQALVVKHLSQVDAMIEQSEAERLSHDADRVAWLESMRECHAASAKILEVSERTERKVGGLYGRHEVLLAKLEANTKPNAST